MLEISTSVKLFTSIANNSGSEVCANDHKLSKIAGLVPLSIHQPSEIATCDKNGQNKRESPLIQSHHDSVRKGQSGNQNQHSNNLSPRLQPKPLRTSSPERATPKINNRHSKELLHAVTASKVEEEVKNESSTNSQEGSVNLTQLHESHQKPYLAEIKAVDKLVGVTASISSLGTLGTNKGGSGGCSGFVTRINNNNMSQKSSSSFLLPLHRATATAALGESESSATSTVVSSLPPPSASVAIKTGSSSAIVKIPPSSFDTASSSSATSTSSDVTSSGSSSPPAGITKLETLDFTASQDAFDDLASIVGISMGADSTVPNMDGDLDLDAWIENTAQNIKPLVSTLADSSSSSSGGCNNVGHSPLCSSNSLDIQTLTAVKQSTAFSMITNHHQSMMPVAAAAAAAALISGSSSDANSAPSSSTSSTLQSLLQGSLNHSLPCANGVAMGQQVTKMTQLQQRDLHHPVTAAAAAAAAAVAATSSNHPQLPPPPYSILQNRLQLGAATASNRIQNKSVGSSSFEMIKQLPPSSAHTSAEFATSTTVSPVGHFGGSSSPADSLPHSTNGGNDVTGSSSCASAATAGSLVQRRLGEMAAAAAVAHSLHSKLKHSSKQSSKMRHKLSGGSAPSSRTAASDAISAATVASIDHSLGTGGKKMMHHCQICNRGFLNKSNIKVHLRTHTGEKPFKCEHCSKAFRQKAHLLKHMSIHKRISRD